MKLVANEQYGHYWLHQLKLLMRKDPTHVLTKKWLEELSSEYIWKRAEKHFLETNQLWYNELKWPFQICVLEIGGMDGQTILKKWEERRFISAFPWREDISSLALTPSRKIHLIKLEARFLGINGDVHCRVINQNHPQLNLSFCPPETPFFLRFLIKEYFDNNDTTVAMDFHPPSAADKNTQRIYYFNHNGGYGNDVRMGYSEVSCDNVMGPNSMWIFQYNLPA
jgi:hypothetical protein